MSDASVVPSAVIPESHLALNTIPQTDNPNANAYAKEKRPRFFREDADGKWRLLDWIADKLSRYEEGKVQRAMADTLIEFGPAMYATADAVAGCDNAWIPYKGCEVIGEDGKKHQVDLAKSKCYKPFCPIHQDERERLDHFMVGDNGDLMAAISEIVESCEQEKRNPMVARIRLTMLLPSNGTWTYAGLRKDQEAIQDALTRWRDRITREHGILPHQYGIVVSDLPTPHKPELWLLYIGPSIPFESFRDNWKAVAGNKARVWHMRRPVTVHDTQCSQDAFEGMIEAELQHIFTLPWWIRTADGKRRAMLQAAFYRYHMIRKVGHFYAYDPPPQTVSGDEAEEWAAEQAPITEEQLAALCNVPVEESSHCRTCHEPLVFLHGRGAGHLHEFHDSYAHVRLHHGRVRAEHKHNSVSMCGEEYDRYQRRKAALSHSRGSPPS